MKKITRDISKIALMLILTLSFLMSGGILSYASEKNNNKSGNPHVSSDIIDIGNLDGEIKELTITNSTGKKSNDIVYNIGIPNAVWGTLTPGENGFALKVNNTGIDALNTFSGKFTLTDNYGNFIDAYKVGPTSIPIGSKTFTWVRAKSNTVQEKISFSGVAIDDVNYYVNVKTVRYNFVGGAYGRIPAYGGHVHHCPADSISPLSTYNGPAVRMLTEDHLRTASYGSSISAIQYRSKQKTLITQGKFLAAQQMDIDDLRSKFGSKYDKAIIQMVGYTKFELGYTQ